MADSAFATAISAAYSTTGEAIDLGRGVLNGELVREADVKLPLAMMTRHGLIAGATGTGKTKTLQGLAEQLSAAGVPVFVADVKGDVSGLADPGSTDPTGAAVKRATDLGITFTPTGFPVEFLSLGGIGPGVPVRATVSDFGPQLLGKVLGANDTQEQSLGLIFRYADQKQLPILDLSDLRALLTFLSSDDGKGELTGIGGLSPATVGVLLRSLVGLEDGGGTELFGEPQFQINDMLRLAPDGRGVISCLELPAVQDRPKLFSTALMWLLAELFEALPEVGDLAKPKLVFFFDEAHLLFDGATPGLHRFRHPDRAPDPLEGRRHLLHHADAEGHPRRRARAARQPRPARTAGIHAGRREGAARNGQDVSEIGLLRRRHAAHLDGDRRGCGDDPLGVGRADPGRAHAARPAALAHGPDRQRRCGREGLAALREVRNARRQPERARAARGTDGSPAAAAAAPAEAPKPTEPQKAAAAAAGGGLAAVTDFLKSRQGQKIEGQVVRGIFGLLKK